MKKLLALLSIAIFASAAALASRPQLVKSTPADGSSGPAPSAFIFEFSEPASFHELHIVKDGGKRASLGELPRTNAKTLTVRAPSLTSGQYVLEWSVFTNSIALSGRIRFTVTPEPAAAPSAPR